MLVNKLGKLLDKGAQLTFGYGPSSYGRNPSTRVGCVVCVRERERKG